MAISVHRQFEAPGEPRERATHAHAQAGQLVLSYSKQRRPRKCGHYAQTYDLLVLRSPQLSFTSRPYVDVAMNLYRQLRAFLLQVKGW